MNDHCRYKCIMLNRKRGLNMIFNKRGMTLIELLISIVFVGIVLVFMFNMLNGLKNETNNNDYAYNNQANKIDAIHTIQKDLNAYILQGIQDNSVTDINLKFYFLKELNTKTANLYVSHKDNKTYVNYENVDGEKFSWEMKGANVDTCGKFTIYNVSNVLPSNSSISDELENNNYYFIIHINLYNDIYNERNNKDNNNQIDDLEISFYDYNYNLVNNNSYLTSKNNGTYNIGKC